MLSAIKKEWPERTVAVCNDLDTAITVDDSCYIVNNWTGKKWHKSPWIFEEAIQRIKYLPDNPNDAEDIIGITEEEI